MAAVCASGAWSQRRDKREDREDRRVISYLNFELCELLNSLLCSRRLIPDVASEPVEILLHRGAIGFRLGQAVAEALEDRQLHRHVLIAQALIQLERIRNRHPRVSVAVLDQRRRLRLLDVGHRRRVGVDLRIVPRRRLQVLPRERVDVGVDVIRHPVRDAGADRDRLEPIGVARRQERGDVAALAPAHAADAIAIDEALLHQRIDAREHVPRVADAEIAHVERSELLAVSGAAAIVRLEDERALSRGRRRSDRSCRCRTAPDATRRSDRRESRPAGDNAGPA